MHGNFLYQSSVVSIIVLGQLCTYPYEGNNHHEYIEMLQPCSHVWTVQKPAQAMEANLCNKKICLIMLRDAHNFMSVCEEPCLLFLLVICLPCVCLLLALIMAEMCASKTGRNLVPASSRQIYFLSNYTQPALISPFPCCRNFVICIVGLTTNLDKVSPRIQRLFLHEIKMTPPNYTQRLQMLTAMGRGIPTSPGEPRSQASAMIDHVFIFSPGVQTGLNFEDIAHKSAVSFPERECVCG